VQFGNVAWKPDAAILVPWADRLCQSVHVSDRSLLIYDGTWAENGEDISDIATLGYFILKLLRKPIFLGAGRCGVLRLVLAQTIY